MSQHEAGTDLFIGLTGGIGSGKSTVAVHIAQRHPVLYADTIARECMLNDEQVRADLTQLFGQQVYLSDGSLDRGWLAEVVFNDGDKLAKLNAIVHPPTHERILAASERLFSEGARMVFVESALIYEARLDEDFDYVLSVLSDPEIAVQRITERDGVTAASVRDRMRHQLAPEEKADLADFTIRNNGTVEELLRAADIILMMLTALRRRRP
jgi:dephospho-CoA kinase